LKNYLVTYTNQLKYTIELDLYMLQLVINDINIKLHKKQTNVKHHY
jgi:hypothetical protein